MGQSPSVKVVELPGRGRALVTTRGVRGGEIVVRESPSLVYVNSVSADRFCAQCLRICSGPGGGKVARFCSPECSDSFPADLVAGFSRLKEERFDVDLEDQGRFLLTGYHIALVSPGEFEKLLLLEGEVGTVGKRVRKLHGVVERVTCTWNWKGKPSVSVKMTGNLLEKEKRNGFGLLAPSSKIGERLVRGFALYTKASFINHECLPNCTRFDYLDGNEKTNTDIFIRALHDLPQDTEITISYFPINWRLSERQAKLQAEYGFECACERCRAEKGWSDAESEEHDSENGEERPAIESSMESLHLRSDPSNKQDSEFQEQEEEDGNFGHAMFFVKYLCPVEECGGTMTPVVPVADANMEMSLPGDTDLFTTMECNACGLVRTGDEFRVELEESNSL